MPARLLKGVATIAVCFVGLATTVYILWALGALAAGLFFGVRSLTA